MSIHCNITRKRFCRGMTLIEMLIVLGIMAAMAGVMVKGIASTDNRVRTDRSRQILSQLRIAVFGDGSEVSRFIQDMGRLPVVASTVEGEILSELWRCPHNDCEMAEISLTASSWAPADGNAILDKLPDVYMNVGWDGPYLLMNNPDESKLYDGFGNYWQISSEESPNENTNSHWKDNDATTMDFIGASKGDSIAFIRSLGRNISVDTGASVKSENHDLYLDLQGQMADVELIVRIKAQNNQAKPSVWANVKERTDTYIDASSYSDAANWQSGVAIAAGERVNADGNVFECTTAGGTGVTQPSWSDYEQGETVTDGEVVWTCVWQKREDYQLNRLRAVLFYPQVTVEPAAKALNTVDYVSEDDGFTSLVTLTGMTSGLRKLYVYGYYDGDEESLIGSGVCDVCLKPGKNYITIYLSKEQLGG